VQIKNNNGGKGRPRLLEEALNKELMVPELEHALSRKRPFAPLPTPPGPHATRQRATV